MEYPTDLLAILIGFYFLPTVVAIARRHHNGNSIAVLNLVAGWTFIGWVVALVSSVSATRVTPSDPPPRS